jgi:threonine aldolase
MECHLQAVHSVDLHMGLHMEGARVLHVYTQLQAVAEDIAMFVEYVNGAVLLGDKSLMR